MYDDVKISYDLYTSHEAISSECKICTGYVRKKNSLSNRRINGKQDVATYPC